MKKFLLFILLFAGCSEEYRVEQEEPTDHVVSMMFDRSPSFEDRTEDAFTYFGRVIKSFTRATSGENTKVLISQVGSDVILFHGSPTKFTREFETKAKFKAALASPNDSRVFLSMAETIEKLNRMHKEHAGMKSCFVCLSDLVDNASGAEGWGRLDTALGEYAKHGGVVALHWVQDEPLADKWRTILKNHKFKSYVVTTRKDSEPPVPRF